MTTEEQTLAAIIGRSKAYEYAVELLIAASPERERLRAAWDALLPTIVDVHTELPSAAWPTYRQAFQAALSRLSALLRRSS